MRQLTPVSNLVLACLGALGLIGSLGLPWYAAPVKDTNVYDGPIERGAFHVSKVFAHSAATTSGSTAAGSAKPLLFALAALLVVLAGVGLASPGARAKVRDALRAVALVSFPVLLYLAVAHPGAAGALRIHWGLPASFAIAVFTVSAAWHGGEVRLKRGPTGAWAHARR
jgi:hypothetical protein